MFDNLMIRHQEHRSAVTVVVPLPPPADLDTNICPGGSHDSALSPQSPPASSQMLIQTLAAKRCKVFVPPQ